MCHRPRTQRIGPDSTSRELEVCETDGRSELSKIRMVAINMVEEGYPYSKQDYKYKDFQVQPNDEFYLKIE